MARIEMQQMMDQWVATAKNTYDTVTKLSQQLSVSDAATKAELDTIKARLLAVLDVKDSTALVELKAILAKLGTVLSVKDADALTILTAIETKLNAGVGVTNWPSNQSVTDATAKAELELLKSELQAIKTKLGDGSQLVQVTGSILKHQLLAAQKPATTRTYYGKTIGTLANVNTVVPVDISAVENMYIYIKNNADISTRNNTILHFYDAPTAGSFFWGLEDYVMGDIPAGGIIRIALVEKIDVGLGSDIVQIPKKGTRGVAVSLSMTGSGVGTLDVAFMGGKPYVYGGGA